MHVVHLLYFVRDEKSTEKSGFLTSSGKVPSSSFVLNKRKPKDIELESPKKPQMKDSLSNSLSSHVTPQSPEKV